MKKYRFAKKLLVFDIILLLLAGIIFGRRLMAGEPFLKSSAAAFAEADAYDNALIFTYLNDIETAVTAYYQNFYTNPPTVSFYVVQVKEVKEAQMKKKSTENKKILLTFLVKPYLGAHVTVGEDEITFLASYTGEVRLIGFEHLKGYELPEHLKGLKKQA